MSDSDLIARFLATRADAAFGDIVNRHSDLIYGVCLRVLGDASLAEDATQATFIVLLRRIETLRKDQPLSGWLYCVAERVARNMRKSNIRQERRENQVRAVQQSDPDSSWENVRPELDGALASLPDVQRDAVVLRYLKGLSRQEVASELKCPERTVDTRLTRALAALRQRLGAQGVSVSAMVLAGGLADHAIATAPAKLSASIAAACLGKGAVSATASAAAENAIRTMFDSKALLRPRARASTPSSTAGVIAATVVLAGGLLAWNFLAPAKSPAPAPIPIVATPKITLTPPPTPANVVYPLKVSANGRYLVDQNNAPFLWVGEAANSAIVELTPAQMDQYLDDRKAKGFSLLQVCLLEHKFSKHPPFDAAGDPPFSSKLNPGINDFTAPNEAYFRNADLFLAKAAERKMCVLLVYSHLGWGGGDEGWFAEMKANGPDRLKTWGRWLGTRYKNQPNIIWQSGGDFTPAPSDQWVIDAVVEGIRECGATQLMTVVCARTEIPCSAYSSRKWLELNNVFCNAHTPMQELFRTEYARTPVRPVFLVEALYEKAVAADAALLRRQAYVPYLTGGCGQIFGHEGLCTFESSNPKADATAWQKDLDTPGSRDVARLASLLKAHDWWKLIPDSAHTLLTGGFGSDHTEIVAARAEDGTLAMVYVPSSGAGSSEFTLALNQMSGPIAAEWFNPTSGAITTVQGSPFQNTASRKFTTPGNNGTGSNDWLLILSRKDADRAAK